MVKFPSKEAVERLREQYPTGTRIELLSMDDPYTTLKPGDKGAVTDIDSTGTIFVEWDSGSTLGLVYGVDSYRRVVEPIYEHAAEFWGHLKEVSVDLNAALAVGGKYIGAKAKSECTANEKQFCRELFAAMYEDTAGTADDFKSIYPHDYSTAYDKGEDSLYTQNRERNVACATRIDYLIDASQYKTNYYNLELAAMRAVHDYGFDRVNMVLARNIKARYSDGRFSGTNKQWARDAQFPEQAFESAVLNAHPILIEDFTKYTRKLYDEVGAERFAQQERDGIGEPPAIEEKPSVMKQIRDAQKASPAPRGDKAPGKRKNKGEAEH